MLHGPFEEAWIGVSVQVLTDVGRPLTRSTKDAKVFGTFPLIGFVSTRRNCWLTLAALRIARRSANQTCETVVPRHKSRARATLLGSLPGVAASSFSLSPTASKPSRSHRSARSSPCAGHTATSYSCQYLHTDPIPQPPGRVFRRDGEDARNRAGHGKQETRNVRINSPFAFGR
jgi:hypothetical protein